MTQESSKSWDSDEDCVKTISDILSLLPKLKSNGSISSYVATEGLIRIQLSTNKTRSRKWFSRSDSEHN